MNWLFRYHYQVKKIPLRHSILMLAGVIVLSWITVSQAATFKDPLGRKVTLNTPPKRIVSMAPSLTEIFYYLGLETMARLIKAVYECPVIVDKNPAAESPRVSLI